MQIRTEGSRQNTTQKRRKIAWILIGMIFSMILLSGCSGANGDFLAWNREELRFIGRYEEGGITYTCRFALASGRGKTEATAEILSPAVCEGITYCYQEGTYSVSYGGRTLPLSEEPEALRRLFLCRPTSPYLETVSEENGMRRETVRAEEGVYTFCYGSDNRPSEILCNESNRYAALMVETWE